MGAAAPAPMPSALSTPAPCARRSSPCVCVPYTRAQLLPTQEKPGWLGFPSAPPPPVATLPPSFAFPCQGSPSDTPSTALLVKACHVDNTPCPPGRLCVRGAHLSPLPRPHRRLPHLLRSRHPGPSLLIHMLGPWGPAEHSPLQPCLSPSGLSLATSLSPSFSPFLPPHFASLWLPLPSPVVLPLWL